MKAAFHGLPVIAAVVVCLLFDLAIPFGGAFHLEPAGHWVEMSAWASSEEKAPAVACERIVEFVTRPVDAMLPGGPVSARTPAARPPPVV